MTTTAERFWSKVDKSGGPDACWLWTGMSDQKGYGKFYIVSGGRQGTGQPRKRRVIGASRWAYQERHGELPAHIQVDHRDHCNTLCVNPAHLRPVTNKQNGENKRGAMRNSSTGIRGVSFNRAKGQYGASVGHHGRRYHLGWFDDVAAAEKAVVGKRLELFTHNEKDKRKVLA